MAKYFELDDLYRFLTPTRNGDDTNTKAETTADVVRDLLFPPKGDHKTAAAIVADLKRKNLDVKDKIRILCPTSVYESGGGNYWSSVKHGEDTKTIASMLSASTESPDGISVIVIRDPALSPSAAGVDKIGRFLNYTPPLVASQMVPYLDVMFSFSNANGEKVNDYTKSPGIIRFLLGSQKKDGLSPADKLLSDPREGKEEVGSVGMEMFLMPQTLTNMDDIYETRHGDSLVRLLPPRPFVPMASLEGFDITVQNAGAGTFCSKRGNLKFKIHDKSRVSEFAEFLQGSAGAATVQVNTTFGWRAPEGRDDEDAFCKFINTYMQQTDRWAVVNTSFAFDATGQVNITVQLASDPRTNRDPTLVVSKKSAALEYIEERRHRIKAIYTGLLPDSAQVKKDVEAADVKKYMKILKMASEGKYEKLTREDGVNGDNTPVNEQHIESIFTPTFVGKVRNLMGDPDKLKEDLLGTLSRLKGGNANLESEDEKRREANTTGDIASKFNTIFDTPDPFLPRTGTDFKKDLVKFVEGYKIPPPSNAKSASAPKPPSSPPVDTHAAEAAAIEAQRGQIASGLMSSMVRNYSSSN